MMIISKITRPPTAAPITLLLAPESVCIQLDKNRCCQSMHNNIIHGMFSFLALPLLLACMHLLQIQEYIRMCVN